MNRDKYIIDRKNGICECKKHGRIWREGECFGERPMPNNVLGPACKDCVTESIESEPRTFSSYRQVLLSSIIESQMTGSSEYSLTEDQLNEFVRRARRES